MGTSKSYSASIKGQPQWGELSSVVTSNCGGGTISNQNLDKILSRYINVVGGSARAGRGLSKISGRAGIRTAKRLGTFLSSFASSRDLSAALAETGLTDLAGKSLNDILNHLLEYCSGPASTIDDVAAKAASKQLWEELAGEAASIEEFEAALAGAVATESLQEIVIKYFAYYIFEHLSIMFYEKLVAEKGKTSCNDLFRQVKDFILEKLRNMDKRNSLQNIDWGGDEADRLIKNIQEDVLKIFDGYEG